MLYLDVGDFSCQQSFANDYKLCSIFTLPFSCHDVEWLFLPCVKYLHSGPVDQAVDHWNPCTVEFAFSTQHMPWEFQLRCRGGITVLPGGDEYEVEIQQLLVVHVTEHSVKNKTCDTGNQL